MNDTRALLPILGPYAVALAGLLFLLMMKRSWTPYPFYAGVLAFSGVVAAALMNDTLYLAVFALGIATGFAEVLGKFPDEPVKALATPHALGYLLLNGVIAVFALYILSITLEPSTIDEAGDRVALVAAAGFGSMMIMRSKLFNLKVGGEEVAFGPEQVILVYFRWMESAIDRARARSRIEFVRLVMRDIDFDRVHEYCVTMLDAAQRLEPGVRRELDGAIAELVKAEVDRRHKAYRLGFLLLNTMGEEFVRELFEQPPPEWLLRAPLKERPEGLIRRFVAIRGDLPYMAYATSMCSPDFRKRLGWTDMEETRFRESVQPRRCTLKGWRLAFNHPASADPASGVGEANVVPDPAGAVEGVLYRLPKESIEFLDSTESGYVRQEVTVTVDGKETRAHLYVAETTRDDLVPDPAYLRLVLQGAREHALPPEYVAGIEALLADAEAVARV